MKQFACFYSDFRGGRTSDNYFQNKHGVLSVGSSCSYVCSGWWTQMKNKPWWVVWYMLRDWPNHAKSALLQQGKAWETELKDASSSLNVSSSRFAYFMCYALPLSCWHFSGFDDSTNSNVGELRLASSSQATSVRVKRDEGFDAKYNLVKLSLCFSIYFLTVESTVVSPSLITSLIGSALKLAR